jgi:uncharacterized protein YcbK (DUF882 family)
MVGVTMGDLSDHFSRSEFACSCGCGYGTRPGDVSEELLHLLERMRDELGEPIYITSGCRCIDHNAACGGIVDSAHTRGTAADIKCSGGANRRKRLSGANRRKLVDTAVMHFASGIGVAKTFVHVDVCDVLPRPSAWSY